MSEKTGYSTAKPLPRKIAALKVAMALTVAAAIALWAGADAAKAQAAQEAQEAQRVEEPKEVNVYSYRQPFLVQPLFDAFEEETGIAVNVVYASKGLIERAAAEGENSPADVILTVDIGRLDQAVKEGVTQAVESDVLAANIPAEYRDPDGHWFGLTRRGRVVFASRERVSETALTYEELADPKWKGRICTRSGAHVYNLALIASMIAHHGEDEAKAWLAGLRDNLARKPQGNDRAQAEAVYQGECDLAIANTYYLGAMITNDEKPEQKEWADAVRIIFPNTETRGTHVNISGIVMAKYAPHPNNAKALMEFLSSEEAQAIYAEANFEYPVKPGVPVSDLVASWGEFTADTLPLSEIAAYRPAAARLVDIVGFDQ